jgi:hypothetical protein
VTSIVAWAGIDSRGPASVYIASDSRISWGATHRWDRGRKTFASAALPYVFGYSGDVLFPSMALPIVIEQIASGVIPNHPRSAFGEVGNQIRRLWLEYPQEEHRDFSIVMAARTGEKMAARFFVAVMTFRASDGSWEVREEPMPATSASLLVAGSGASEIRSAERLWQASAHANTSRAVFSAFCESMRGGVDPLTGGGPQLVGLHRIGSGRTFGVIYDGRRYLAGSLVDREGAATSTTSWFNELFERFDGERLTRLADAQPHLSR